MEDRPKRRRVRHKLTSRDYEILQFIDEENGPNREDIRLRFWPGKNNNHHHRRLRILMRLRVIREIGYERYFGMSFGLTKRGQNELANNMRHCHMLLAS